MTSAHVVETSYKQSLGDLGIFSLMFTVMCECRIGLKVVMKGII